MASKRGVDLEDEEDEREIRTSRVTFDVVDGPTGDGPRDDDFDLVGLDDDDAEPEPCLLCEYSGANQTDPVLQSVVAQIENKVTMSSGMGMKHKVKEIQLAYEKTIKRLLPAGTPEWTRDSIRNHLNGMHGTSSAATLKAVDISSMAAWMHALKGFALKRRRCDGKIVDVNSGVFKLRMKLSEIVQKLPDK